MGGKVDLRTDAQWQFRPMVVGTSSTRQYNAEDSSGLGMGSRSTKGIIANNSRRRTVSWLSTCHRCSRIWSVEQIKVGF